MSGELIRKKMTARRRLGEASLHISQGSSPGQGGGKITDYEPRRGQGKARMARIGVGLSAGKLYCDPAVTVAYRIRHALTAPPRSSTCRVYDAAGNLIATIDPLTRKRS